MVVVFVWVFCVWRFSFGCRVSHSGALKAANLQQCMGTAEGSPMWLGVGLGVGGSEPRYRVNGAGGRRARQVMMQDYKVTISVHSQNSVPVLI